MSNQQEHCDVQPQITFFVDLGTKRTELSTKIQHHETYLQKIEMIIFQELHFSSILTVIPWEQSILSRKQQLKRIV